MKFNLLRFLMLLILPVLIIGTFVFGVAIYESYEEKGDYLVPQNPVAHEPAKFSYQLTNPVTKEPLSNANVQLEIIKTKATNPWFNVGYLRDDNEGTGLVYKMDSILYDGKLEIESIFWDAGSYEAKIKATSNEIDKPIEITLPIKVDVPLGQIVRTIVLFIAIFLLAMLSGIFAKRLENPFKKQSPYKNRYSSSAAALFLIASLLVGGTLSSTSLAHEATSDNHIMVVEKNGVKTELKLNPMDPVQKGEPAHFNVTFQDSKTGQYIQGMDTSLSLYHEDDNITMFSNRTQLQDGKLDFDYAFPDTANFHLIFHASPNGQKSTLTAPLDGVFAFEVPPVQPNLSAQLRAGTLMLIVLILGFVLGLVGTKRKPSFA